MLRFLSLPLVSPTFEGLSSKAVTVMCPSRGGGEQGERGTQGGAVQAAESSYRQQLSL